MAATVRTRSACVVANGLAHVNAEPRLLILWVQRCKVSLCLADKTKGIGQVPHQSRNFSKLPLSVCLLLQSSCSGVCNHVYWLVCASYVSHCGAVWFDLFDECL